MFKRIAIINLLAVLLCMRGTGSSFAEPALEARLEPQARLNIAEPCQLILNISWRKSEGDFLFTEPRLDLQNLKLDQSGVSAETFLKEGEDWKRKVFTFRLIPQKTGKARVSAFSFRYVNPQTQDSGKMDVRGWELSVIPDYQKIIRNGSVSTAWVGGLGLTTLAIIMFARRRRRKDLLGNLGDHITLEEKYLQRIQSNNPAALRNIFQDYLQEKYALPEVAPQSEFLDHMEGKADSKDLRFLREFWSRWEEWRYGSGGSSEADGKRLRNQAVDFVKMKSVVEQRGH